MEIKNIRNAEVKFTAEGSLEFSGYASKYNGVDSYGDTIMPGAYKKTLESRERPVLLRWNHWGPVIGKFTEIFEDEQGLFVRGELTKGHSVANDAAALLRHGAISGLSIGYYVVDADDNMPHAGRKLKEIDLIEISIVEEPADLQAQVDSIKSAKSLKEVESKLCREFGFSQSQSTAIVSSVKKAIQHGDRVKQEEADIIEMLNSIHKG